MSFSLHTPNEVAHDLADRVRQRRLDRRWTQAELAVRAGVALSTLKLFEHRGHISLERLLRIAAALDSLDLFQKLFEPPAALSLAELEKRVQGAKRHHGRRSKKLNATAQKTATGLNPGERAEVTANLLRRRGSP
jgi:transcriptional regulator with XRE-family HTH domain